MTVIFKGIFVRLSHTTVVDRQYLNGYQGKKQGRICTISLLFSYFIVNNAQFDQESVPGFLEKSPLLFQVSFLNCNHLVHGRL